MILTWKYSLPAFLVPFAFTLDPRGLGLLLQADVVSVLLSTTTAAIGVVALSMGLGGLGLRSARVWPRVLATAGGVLLFHPAPLADLAGVALVGVAFLGRRTT
jgi:TRAP-type uncharacterized transport system fused permease subunit